MGQNYPSENINLINLNLRQGTIGKLALEEWIVV